ncbi:MAG: hypothetical protein PHS14_16800 [Elusimicrobia bacterium]|nr:hypothetical protein [Elusimicrobiota bacterium]
MRHLFSAALAGLLLPGCSKEVLPDYPLHGTAVTRTYFHNLGFKGLFASESTRTVSTRADMRREEDEFKFTGMMMKHLAGGRGGAVIWRVDKNKQWRLDPKTKTYAECPLLGCPPSREPQEARPEPPSQEPPRKKPSCALTLARNKLSVDATAESREINGFKARRYKVSWEVVLQDKDKKKNTSLVTIDIWTTPENDPRIEAVRTVDRNFEQHVKARAPERSGVGKVVPAEAMNIIAMQFLAGLSADQRAAVTAASKELGKIRGLPVSTRLEWNLGGDACQSEAQAAPKEAPPSGIDVSHGVGGLLGSAAKRGAQSKADEMAAKPVFAFIEEIQKMDVEPASDGLFVPPPSYKLSSAAR